MIGELWRLAGVQRLGIKLWPARIASTSGPKWLMVMVVEVMMARQREEGHTCLLLLPNCCCTASTVGSTWPYLDTRSLFGQWQLCCVLQLPLMRLRGSSKANATHI